MARSSQPRHSRASSVYPWSMQRLERERSVAQPAEAVVPVAGAAGLLGQRGGGRRDDAAGVLVGQRPQHQQGARHRLAVAAPRDPFATAVGPVLPPPLRRGQAGRHVDPRGRLAVGGVPGDGQVDDVAGRHPDPAGVGAVAVDLHGLGELAAGAEQHGVGPRAGEQAIRGVAGAADAPQPRHHRPVPEPDDVLLAQLHAAGDADDTAHQVGPAVALGHRVDHVDDADLVVGTTAALDRPAGAQDEAVALVGPRHRQHPRAVRGRGDRPVAVLPSAEQCREGRGGVEAGQAQPVDGAPAAHQRRRVAVADQRVVLDRRRRRRRGWLGGCHRAIVHRRWIFGRVRP